MQIENSEVNLSHLLQYNPPVSKKFFIIKKMTLIYL